MNLAEFDYHLPEELIATRPLEDRAASRMLVVHRVTGEFSDKTFRDLPQYLEPGDCLVINDSKVIPSRLYGRKDETHGKVEVFLLRADTGDPFVWTVLVRPGRKVRMGDRILFAPLMWADVLGHGVHGERTVRFSCPGTVYEMLEQIGHVPLPLYIHRPDETSDRERYQTVYATQPGSVAAPTAGLHFTPEILSRCETRGATIARVTLHVGLGTFEPLHSEEVEANQLRQERYSVAPESEKTIRAARRRIAVGTTSARTLETLARAGPCGDTSLFIYPGFEFQLVDALVTNFHLPKSSLLLLVSALAGKDLVLAAYRHAVESGYRFYSYGDCMLVI